MDINDEMLHSEVQKEVQTQQPSWSCDHVFKNTCKRNDSFEWNRGDDGNGMVDGTGRRMDCVSLHHPNTPSMHTTRLTTLFC